MPRHWRYLIFFLQYRAVKIREQCTVKPEFNDHPRDPQKVVVVQKVVVGQRLVINFIVILVALGIKAGRCRQAAVVKIWLLTLI